MSLWKFGLRLSALAALALVVFSPLRAEETEDDKKDKGIADLTASHVQIGSIDVCSADKTLGLNAFCLDSSGNILAAVGKSTNAYGRKEKDEKLESGVRVFSVAGEMIDYWPLDFSPQAIGYGKDDFIYVGGEGKLAKLDRSGKVVASADAPNLANREEMVEQIRSQLEASQKQMVKTYTQMVERLQKQVDELADQDDDELEDSEKKLLKRNNQLLKNYKQILKSQQDRKIDERTIESMISSKSRISSISHNGENVFVACAATKGYGFDVWKLDGSLENGENVVQGLSGCCGQMDVQATDKGIYVAENSRHRVVHYDLEGKKLQTFGKRDAKGENGFGSCCNPMNLCFDGKANVITAESGTGRILQFDSEGGSDWPDWLSQDHWRLQKCSCARHSGSGQSLLAGSDW